MASAGAAAALSRCWRLLQSHSEIGDLRQQQSGPSIAETLGPEILSWCDGQELLDVTKAEREAGIHPDRHLDDRRWKTVTTIGAQIRSTHLSVRQRDKAAVIG